MSHLVFLQYFWLNLNSVKEKNNSFLWKLKNGKKRMQFHIRPSSQDIIISGFEPTFKIESPVYFR